MSFSFYGRVRMGQGFGFGARGKSEEDETFWIASASKLRDSSWSSGSHSLLRLLDGMWDHKLVSLAVSPLRFFERIFKAADVISGDYLFALHISRDIIEWRNEKLDGAGIIYKLFRKAFFTRRKNRRDWWSNERLQWMKSFGSAEIDGNWPWGESRDHHRSHCSSKLQFFIRWFPEHGKRSPKFIVEAARRIWKRCSTHLQFMAQLE